MRRGAKNIFSRTRLIARARRLWVHLASPFGDNKGQSLAELATFGVILLAVFGILVSYGMHANYQQKLNMQAFRRAHVRAHQYLPFMRHFRPLAALQSAPSFLAIPPFYENGIAIPPSNNYKNVTYTMIEDKPIPTVSGIFPVGKRTPLMASAEAVWSIDMYSGGTIDFFNFDLMQALTALSPLNMPRADFEINGRRYSYITNYFAAIPDLPDLIVSAIPSGGGLMQFFMPEIGALIDLLVPSIINRSNDDERDGIQNYVVDETDNSSLQKIEAARISEDTPGSTITIDTIDAAEDVTRNFRFYKAGSHRVVSPLRRQATEIWITPNDDSFRKK